MLKQAVEATENFFEERFSKPVDIISIVQNNEGWELIAEMITDEEYTKKRARNDLISVFKVQVNKKSEVISYTRQQIRERGRPVEQEEN